MAYFFDQIFNLPCDFSVVLCHPKLISQTDLTEKRVSTGISRS